MRGARARKLGRGRDLRARMAKRGIWVRAASDRGLAEEAGIAYKDVDEVARASDEAGLSRRVRERGVLTDYRDDLLRVGPEPYLGEDQLIESVELLGESLAALEAGSP